MSEHPAYWRERIAGMSDEELSKWVDGIAHDKFAARVWSEFPTDAQVEAAAKMVHNITAYFDDDFVLWADLSEDDKASRRNEALAVLEAAHNEEKS